MRDDYDDKCAVPQGSHVTSRIGKFPVVGMAMNNFDPCRTSVSHFLYVFMKQYPDGEPEKRGEVNYGTEISQRGQEQQQQATTTTNR